MSKNEMNSNVITIERTFNAPIQLVWEAWTRPEHIAHWWGPKGVEIEVIQHDFSVGGKWKYTMPMPNGQEFVSEGEYREIIQLKKIVTTADFKPMTEGVVLEVLLEERGEQTHFIFNVIHKSEEYARQQEKMGIYNGWGSVFSRLDDHLNSLLNTGMN